MTFLECKADSTSLHKILQWFPIILLTICILATIHKFPHHILPLLHISSALSTTTPDLNKCQQSCETTHSPLICHAVHAPVPLPIMFPLSGRPSLFLLLAPVNLYSFFLMHLKHLSFWVAFADASYARVITLAFVLNSVIIQDIKIMFTYLPLLLKAGMDFVLFVTSLAQNILLDSCTCSLVFVLMNELLARCIHGHFLPVLTTSIFPPWSKPSLPPRWFLCIHLPFHSLFPAKHSNWYSIPSSGFLPLSKEVQSPCNILKAWIIRIPLLHEPYFLWFSNFTSLHLPWPPFHSLNTLTVHLLQGPCT